MKLLADGNVATELDDLTFERVLNIYPEEGFATRPIFTKAIEDGAIKFQDLKKEADRLIIPWQMFFLNGSNLDAELRRIEKLRHKASKRLLSKRAGSGRVTSKRILDRLIRCQTYVAENHGCKGNTFCGSLRGRSITAAAEHMRMHFAVSRETLRRKNKPGALAYLIEKFEAGDINVCQGVLTNKILPHIPGSRSVYKSTSGFVIRDDHYPFAFIPSEINPDEREGRQIFTLIFLVALIGLEAYDYEIEKNFAVSMLGARGRQRTAYNIASEFLMPYAETEPFRDTQVTAAVRDELSKRYKITPTAVIVILRKRNIIDASVYDDLLPPPATGGAKSVARTPSIEKSVRKFNGKFAYDYINADFSAGRITAVQTQYLLFGSINKGAFRKYKSSLGL